MVNKALYCVLCPWSTVVLAIDRDQHQTVFLGLAADPSGSKYKEITADSGTCMWMVFSIIIGICIMMYGKCVVKNPSVHSFGLGVNLSFSMLATFYAWYHGLGKAYLDGTIDPKKDNHCNTVAVIAVVNYVLIAFWCIFGSLFVSITAAAVVGDMVKDRQKKQQLLKKVSMTRTLSVSDYIDSEDFNTKCRKVFNDADLDGNGKLDLSELKHVVLFDLSEEEKAKVAKHDLFRKAFMDKDVDKDNFIDFFEFLEVMKWVIATAKLPVESLEGGDEATADVA